MNLLKKNVYRILAYSALILAVACVTVNVNFPEGAVQKATDDYVKQLYDAKKSTSDHSFLNLKFPQWSFISSAHAVNLTLSLDDPKIAEIQKNQKTRINQIDAHKKKGEIGENNKGFLEIRTEMPLLLKVLKPLVEAENKDREKLYTIAAQKNNTDIKVFTKSFRESFLKTSPPGTPIQNESGVWSK